MYLSVYLSDFISIIESHKIRVRRNPRRSSSPNSAQNRTIPNHIMSAKALSTLVLKKPSNKGESTTSLHSLFQCFTTPLVKFFTLIFNLGFPCCNLNLSIYLELSFKAILSDYIRHLGCLQMLKKVHGSPEEVLCYLDLAPQSLYRLDTSAGLFHTCN